MYIYYRHTDGQVMGVYSDEPNSSVFAAKGYLVAKVPGDIKVTRDMVATVVNGVVTAVRASINGDQPKPNPDAVKKRARDFVIDELVKERAKDQGAPQFVKDAAALL